MTIGERIKTLRTNMNISQVDFAAKIDVSKQTLYKYENNIITNIPSDKIELIAKTCYVSPSYIMGWDEKDEPNMEQPEIVNYYSQLNPTGKQEATKRVEELTHIYKYIDPKAPTPPVPMRYINYYYRLASAGTGEIIFDMPPTKSIPIPATYSNVDYAIGVNGNSMKPKFEDGDTLLVEMTPTINIGEIGIFQVDGKCYVKKLGKGELISINKLYDNIKLNETSTCIGRVVDKLKLLGG